MFGDVNKDFIVFGFVWFGVFIGISIFKFCNWWISFLCLVMFFLGCVVVLIGLDRGVILLGIGFMFVKMSKVFRSLEFVMFVVEVLFKLLVFEVIGFGDKFFVFVIGVICFMFILV